MGWKDVVGLGLLFLLVFGMSATVDIQQLLVQVQNKKAILTGIFLQFVLLPFLGYLTVVSLNLDEAMGITLLVLTSSPGGSYSNWWCSMFNADLALSVTMTAISTLLSIFTLPANLLLYCSLAYDGDVVKNLDWYSLITSLVVVISAIVIGLVCSAKVHSHKFNVVANKLGNIAGISLVVFSALMSNSGEGDARMWNRGWVFYVGVAFPCVVGLVISNIITSILKLKKPERVTTSIECCYQNVGIATSVALTMYEGPDLQEAMGVPLYYGFVEATVLGLYCVVAWKCNWTKAPSNAPFWQVILTSYEVQHAEQKELSGIEITLSDDSGHTEAVSTNGDTLFTYYRFGDRMTNLVGGTNNVRRSSFWGRLYKSITKSGRKTPSGMYVEVNHAAYEDDDEVEGEPGLPLTTITTSSPPPDTI